MNDKIRLSVGTFWLVVAVCLTAIAGGYHHHQSIPIYAKLGVGDTTASGDTYIRGGAPLLKAEDGWTTFLVKAVLESDDNSTLGWGLDDTASLYVVSTFFNTPETLATSDCAACPCTLTYHAEVQAALTDSIFGDISLVWYLEDSTADTTLTFNDHVRVHYELIARDN